MFILASIEPGYCGSFTDVCVSGAVFIPNALRAMIREWHVEEGGALATCPF